MKDYFSKQSSHYARYRPVYPQQLFDHILGYVGEKKLAWDCGTGNGQSAEVLAKYFDKVYATDISKNQILHAIKESNITYAVETSEKTNIENKSVNFMTWKGILIHGAHCKNTFLTIMRILLLQ